MLNDAPRRASRPTASRNYTPRAHPMFSIARAAAAARDASESGRDAGIVCRRDAIVRATSGCCIRRPVPRDRSRAPADRVSAVGFRRRACVSVRKPPIGFQALEARAVRRQIFHPSARAKSVVMRWVPDFRIPVDVLARTSSRGRRRRRRREARRGSGRRERDASATRTDANRRRSAPPRSNGAARPRRARGGLRLIWNLVVRSHRRASFVGLRARTRTTRERGTLDERRNERSTRDRA